MKKHTQDLIAEAPRGCSQVGITIGIDLGDVWSHYCTLNEAGEVVDRGRFRTHPSSVDKWFTDLPRVRIAMEAGTHSIWISEQLQELGHEVIVANVRELRAISHSDRKSDQVDAEKLARFCAARSENPQADCAPHSRAAGSPNAHPRPQPHRSSADRCGERSARVGQALRISASRFVHALLHPAVRGCVAARPFPRRSDRCSIRLPIGR